MARLRGRRSGVATAVPGPAGVHAVGFYAELAERTSAVWPAGRSLGAEERLPRQAPSAGAGPTSPGLAEWFGALE